LPTRDRIAKGPGQNAKGVVVAKNVEDLHSDSNNINKQTALSDAAVVNVRAWQSISCTLGEGQ